MDKVDNREIECMVCASCTFKGRKRQEGRKIDRGGAEGCSLVSKRKNSNCRKIVKSEDMTGHIIRDYMFKNSVCTFCKTTEKFFSKSRGINGDDDFHELSGGITVKIAIER